jgi:hypothetical protein
MKFIYVPTTVVSHVTRNVRCVMALIPVITITEAMKLERIFNKSPRVAFTVLPDI